MLYDDNPRQIEILLNEASPRPYLPHIEDREPWDRWRANLGPRAEQIIADADRAATEGFPPLTASNYLRFFRDGDRKSYETPVRARRKQLVDLVLAEAFEPGDRLDPILDRIWAICEETTWCVPAHERGLPDPADPQIDLFAAINALALAEIDMVLADRLDALVRRRIRDEIERRIFTPYMSRNWHWLYKPETVASFNWTAVCNGGVVGAACHLVDDHWRLAEMIARAGRSNERYLRGFCDDGGTSEGVGYWNFGFGYFCILADLVAHKTDDKLDWFDDDRVRRIARFPLRTAMNAGHWPSFSDCPPDATPMDWHVAMLADRLGDDELHNFVSRADRIRRNDHFFPYRAREVRLSLPAQSRDALSWTPAACDFLPDLQWMISRQDPADDDALVLAVKGGHNGEMHNQNDVGSFIVQLGGERLLTDPGSGLYTRQYFRQGHLVFTKQSSAHSTPSVKGHVQAGGKEARAEVIRQSHSDEEDVLELDMTAVYPETDLTSLTRRLRLDRTAPGGRVELLDTFAFSIERPFESILISLIEPELQDRRAVYTGQKAAISVTWNDNVEPEIDARPDVAYSFGNVTLYRLRLKHPTACEGEVRVVIEPA